MKHNHNICGIDLEIDDGFTPEFVDQYSLTTGERGDLSVYIFLYEVWGCTEQGQLNNTISERGWWDGFPHIRSHNRHGPHLVKGIMPRFYAATCDALKRRIAGNGAPLDDASPY
jgi:hypothetical protein